MTPAEDKRTVGRLQAELFGAGRLELADEYITQAMTLRLVTTRFTSPVAAMNVAARNTFTPGTVINCRIRG